MSWRGQGSLPYITAGLGEVNPVKMLRCQGFIDKLYTVLQAGILHKKGWERRQILQGDDIRVWNKFIFIHSKLWGWSRSPQTGIPVSCSQSLCPSGVLVLPLSHGYSQTHTDVLHQQCIFPPKHVLQQPLSPCSTSASGDFISLYSYESNMTPSTSLTFPSMLLL